MLMDLDRFKEVNDTFGHHFGDALLKQVSFRLRTRCAARTSSRASAATSSRSCCRRPRREQRGAGTARRILSTLEQPFVIEGQVLEVGASIGIALYPEHGTDARTLLRRADVAMYTAKQKQSGYSFHREDSVARSPINSRWSWSCGTRSSGMSWCALPAQAAHAQRPDDAREVLMRWNHPKRGHLAAVAVHPARGAHRPDPRRSPTGCWSTRSGSAGCGRTPARRSTSR